MQLFKDVYMVCGYSYSSIDNVYAVKTPSGVILFDTGTDKREWDIIHEQLDNWNLGPITHVVLSHAHINHTFNARAFQEEGAKIVCSRAVAEAIETASDRLIDYEDLSVVYNTKTFRKCKADVVLKTDGCLELGGIRFQAFITNGHSAGGLVLLFEMDGKRILYTGDFIQIAMFNRHADLSWKGDLEYDHKVYMEELKRLSTLEPDYILPGHGQQCLRDAWQMPKNAYIRAVKATHLSLNP